MESPLFVLDLSEGRSPIGTCGVQNRSPPYEVFLGQYHDGVAVEKVHHRGPVLGFVGRGRSWCTSM